MIIHFFLAIILFNFFQISENNWRKEFIPLKSDKTDVEKLLGEPEEKNCVVCTYKTQTEKIIVSYATKKCSGTLSGWNVSSNVVLTFSVYPYKKLKLKDANIDTTQLLFFSSDDLTGYFIDSEKGVKYIVSPIKEIIAISYLPLESDNNLRCKGFPYYTVAGATYRPADSFTITHIEKGKARIENNLIGLKDFEADLKMYVIFYSGDNITTQKYKEYLSKTRKFFYKTLNESQKTIEIIDGGRRKTFKIDIFFLPINYPPPTPTPELVTCFTQVKFLARFIGFSAEGST